MDKAGLIVDYEQPDENAINYIDEKIQKYTDRVKHPSFMTEIDDAHLNEVGNLLLLIY